MNRHLPTAKSIPAPTREADKWMQAGIQSHQGFVRAFNTAKTAALDAGFFFLSARAAIDHGDWGSFCFAYADQISERSIQRYMAFATEAIEWVKKNQPDLKGPIPIQAAAREMVLQSPKPLVSLCRELRLMRRFGEYDSVKYATRQLGNGQLELRFDRVTEWLAPLERIEEAQWVLPEGMVRRDALTQLHDRMVTIVHKIERELGVTNVIDTEGEITG